MNMSAKSAVALFCVLLAGAANSGEVNVWSSRYRNEAVDGKVSFAASFPHVVPASNRTAVARFSYSAVDGRRVDAHCAPEGNVAKVTVDVAGLAFGTNSVEFCLVDGDVCYSASLAFVRLRGKPSRRCTFDGEGRFFIDGRRFMPLGIYCLEINPDDMDILAASPFNCIMPYRAPTLEELDLCAAKNIKVLYDARGKLAEKYGDEEGREWLNANIAKVRHHPAIMAWYADDESPLRRVPRLRERKSLLNELDPDRPVWAVQDKWRRLSSFMGTFDVFGTDPYPVSRDPICNVAKALRLSRRATAGLFPVWQVVQGFRWNEKFRSGELMPSLAEFKSMTWQAIAGGANGLVYFRYHHLREKVNPGAQEWWREAWPRLLEVAGEVKRHEDVILCGEPGAKADVSHEDVLVRTWNRKGVPYALVVNSSTNAISATVALEGLGSRKFELGGMGYVFAEFGKGVR